ncbi:hypothetical protein [uncultured Aliiroseovarius sp.]|nr:hypothetical protein [uncultured Aliiroseovarius sp.]
MERFGYKTRGLTLLFDLNYDRVMFAGAIAAALWFSVILGGMMH